MSRDLRPLDRAPVALRAPFDRRRPLIHEVERARADRAAAVREALDGVELGAYDVAMVEWLAGYDVATAGTILSLLGRVRAAGAAGDGAP